MLPNEVDGLVAFVSENLGNASGVFIIPLTVGSTDGSVRWKAMNKMHINMAELPQVKE